MVYIIRPSILKYIHTYSYIEADLLATSKRDFSSVEPKIEEYATTLVIIAELVRQKEQIECSSVVFLNAYRTEVSIRYRVFFALSITTLF